MKRLFTMIPSDLPDDLPTYQRPSARAIIIHEGRIAMMHSLLYDYYKFPGGGLEEGETPRKALVREVAEEAGLIVNEASIIPYGLVVRQEVDGDRILIQDNYYYFCDVKGETDRILDDYEAQEGFTLEYVMPDTVVMINRTKNHGPKSISMIEREALIIERLIDEGCFRQ